MKKIISFVFVVSLSVQAQSKKWTLQECVQYALEHNISIKQSQLDSQSADIEKSAAVSNFLPGIGASASHSWNIGLNTNIVTNTLENQTTQFTSAGLDAGIDIYKGLQNQNTFRKAKLSQLAAQYKLSKMRDDIALNVANAYLQILFNMENIKVQREQLSLDEKQMVRTQELVNAGSIPSGDLLDIKATVATDQQRVIAGENTLLISKLSLAQLLQLKDFRDFDVADPDYDAKQSEVMFQTPEAIYDKAKQERVEVKIAQTNLAISEKDVQISKGAYQPTLKGFYSFNTRISYAEIPKFDNAGNFLGYGNAAPFFNQFSDNKGHNFGVQLSVPIFYGFATRNNVSRSKVALERSKIALSQAELDLERSVFTAYTDAKGAYKAYEAALTSLQAREGAFNYAKERYAVGMMNAFDFSQAQSLYANAQSEVLRTKYDYIFKTKVVEFYFGVPVVIK
ncbi:TolC family protein [Flavobacterium sp. CYK-4]|uniref:TolC family protein n=1 Tax=Flavobacterium lotistagni TaxID=2709660 RepID=UPI00140BCC6B|nr:TolC family protein [Flavobacterium lotistagni]NHM06774.1 TolC family protein [Flavobacterium lotistagni]